MIQIKLINKIEPVDLGVNGLDKNETFDRKVYFLGVKIWHYEYTRELNVKNTTFNKNKKVGFTKESSEL